VGKNLVYVPECHSTNDLALQLGQQPSTPEGSVIITDRQISGRGQRGNVWEAVNNLNFTFSVIMKPSFLSLQDQFYLNIFTSLGIVDFIKDRTGLRAQIKWPNDILVEGKKLCGILIENQVQGNKFSNSIIGIGLNMNQKTFSVPTATSLCLVAGYDFDLIAEHAYLLHNLESRYLQLRQQQHKLLLRDYLESMYWINEDHTFSMNDITFDGKISGVDEMGRLKVETAAGLRFFSVKEIKYVS
jgi:BirA family biotin operon repressor/biotin-[acetyl-CoA-carboxylase] ligase